MPTTLPTRARKPLDLFIVFVIALAAALFALEIIDPAPMDTNAAMLVATEL